MSLNFSGIPRKSILGRILRSPLRIIPQGSVVPIIQGPLRGKKWTVGSSNHGCWLGSYELPKQRLFVKAIRGGWTVFDVGAHVGYYTLLSSVLTGPAGNVFAFEPNPANLSHLQKHLELNQCSNVTVYQVAVADYCGMARFDTARSSYIGHLEQHGALEVRALTLDSLVVEGTASPNCIKIDVEGSEYRALLGARQVLSEYHPTIFLATHGLEVHKHCCELLGDYGYHLEALPGKHGRTLSDTDEVLAYP